MKMVNKINIGNKKIFLDKENNFLNISEDVKLEIIVNTNNNVKLDIIGTSNYDIDLLVMKNANITVNSLNKNNNVNVNIKLEENSMITYNHSVVSNIDSMNKFNIINSSYSTSFLNNNGVNLGNNKLFFEINGVISSNMKEVNCNQSSKIINYSSGNSKIIPNLIIDSNDIIANHSAYIGEIDKELVFYLESRGIKRKTIENLVYKQTMLSKMNLSLERNLVNQILNEWW